MIEIKNKLGDLEGMDAGAEMLGVLEGKPDIHIDINGGAAVPAGVNKGDRGIDTSGNMFVAVTA